MDMAVESSQTIRRIEVKFLGLTRIETGTTKDYVELPESATIRDVIRVLTEKYGSRLGKTILSLDKNKCHSTARIIVDGNNIEELGGLDHPILKAEGISIFTFPPLAGG
jgi:molybdopterin converting factor small subunit